MATKSNQITKHNILTSEVLLVSLPHSSSSTPGRNSYNFSGKLKNVKLLNINDFGLNEVEGETEQVGVVSRFS